jgi:hypothetical protein
LAQGESGASSLLDKIEADRKELARKEEGSRLALEELEPKITAAQQEITAARRVQDEQEQGQRFREACDKAAALVERVLALHAQACQALAEVRIALNEIGEQFGHRGLAAAERIVQQPLWNLPHQLQTVKKWTHPRVNIAGSSIEILPLLPPPSSANGNGARKSQSQKIQNPEKKERNMFEVSNLDKPRFQAAAEKQASDPNPQLKAAIRVVEATRNYFRVAQKAGHSIPKAKVDQLKASHDDAMDMIVRSLAASGNTAGAIELLRERPRFATPGN